MFTQKFPAVKMYLAHQQTFLRYLLTFVQVKIKTTYLLVRVDLSSSPHRSDDVTSALEHVELPHKQLLSLI